MKIDIHISADSLGDAVEQMTTALAQIGALGPAVTGPTNLTDALTPGEMERLARAAQETAVEKEVAAATAETEKPKTTRKPRATTAPAAETTTVEASAPKDEKPAEITLEKVREVLGLLQTHHPKKTAIVVEIVAEKGNAKRVSEADPSTYAAMYAAAVEWLQANDVAVP